MLSLWRRHLESCRHAGKGGRDYTKCECPIWCEGRKDGKRVRKSMDTRDWARAMRNLGKIEDPHHGLKKCAQPGCDAMVERGRCERHTRTTGQAIAAYKDAHQDIAPATKRSRAQTLQYLEQFTAERGIQNMDDIDLEGLHAFRGVRGVGPLHG